MKLPIHSLLMRCPNIPTNLLTTGPLRRHLVLVDRQSSLITTSIRQNLAVCPQAPLVVDRHTIICLHIWRFISGNGLHKDEIFGSNTYNAVLDYQRKNNLAADSLLLAGRWK